jgi:hypothetical protein
MISVTLPSTRLGWYSVDLTAAFVILFIINAAIFLPAPGVVPWREERLRPAIERL